MNRTDSFRSAEIIDIGANGERSERSKWVVLGGQCRKGSTPGELWSNYESDKPMSGILNGNLLSALIDGI